MPLNTKNGATRYTHIEVDRNKSYFTSDPLNGDNKYTANDICKMIEFLVDNIYVRFGGQLFRQMVGIPIGTNCAPLLADLFLYSYENEFLDKLIKEGKRKLARKFNLSYRYIDDLISFNNKRFKEFISDIYPKELTISETTEPTSVASYLNLFFIRDTNNNITTKLCINQFQAPTSPRATPVVLHLFSARVPGICTIWIARGLPGCRTYYQSTKLSVDAAWRHFSATNWSTIYCCSLATKSVSKLGEDFETFKYGT